MLFAAIAVTEDPERVPMFEMVKKFFYACGYPRIKKNFAAVAVIEGPERVPLVDTAKVYFGRCGYPEELYRNNIVDPKGRVCFLYPGEAIFCFCPIKGIVIEEPISWGSNILSLLYKENSY
jgi:hypothetical protein